MNEIKELTSAIINFRNERNWGKYHTGKDIAICLNIESSELLEAFLWKSDEDVDKQKVKEELADVFYSALLLAEKFGLDVKKIVFDKLEKNKKKYPIEKSKGSNKKYN